MSIYFLLFWSSLIAVSAAAFRFGGWAEKAAAALYLLCAVATMLLRPAIAVRYHEVELAVFLVDVLLLVGLAYIAVRGDRWWPLCATALQGMTVLSHIGRVLNPHLWRYGYQLMAVWASWPMVLVLAAGIGNSWRRRRHMQLRTLLG